MADSTASAIINETLSLRASHPGAPASEVLDLVMQGRHHRRYDFGLNMLPPAPFAYLVAEAAGDLMSAAEWEGVGRIVEQRDELRRQGLELGRKAVARKQG